MKLIASEHFEELNKRGIPFNVLTAQHPDNISKHISHIDIPRESGDTLLDKKKQLNAIASFEKTIGAKKLQSYPFMLICSRSYNFIAQQYALSIVANLIEIQGPKFWWHSVYGGLQDYLRDNDDPPELKGCRLLVLGNVDENSIDYKIEKVRDLLTKYSHIPRILTVGGVDPVTFSKKTLHILPSIFIYC